MQFGLLIRDINSANFMNMARPQPPNQLATLPQHGQYNPPTIQLQRDPRFQHPTAFTTTKYLINDEFAELLGLSEPVTRKEVQNAFINYSINHDFVDLKGHHYLIYKNPKLKAMLGAESVHPKNLFKYLRKMLVPIQRPLTDADVEKIRIKSQIKRHEQRMRKQLQNKLRPAHGSCISELQMELKKEIEAAELDERANFETIKLDLQVNTGKRQRASQNQQSSVGQQQQSQQNNNLSIDDLLTDNGSNRDYSVLFKK